MGQSFSDTMKSATQGSLLQTRSDKSVRSSQGQGVEELGQTTGPVLPMQHNEIEHGDPHAHPNGPCPLPAL